MISCAIINWNTGVIVDNSLSHLLKECDEISIIDNGSIPESVAGFRPYLSNKKIKYAYYNQNQGFSIGKNLGVDLLSTSDYVFLLNGDIEYVPGTIEFYKKILDQHPKAFCIGMFDFNNKGTMGVQDSEKSDTKVDLSRNYSLVKGLPVSWAHYGLYRGDVFFKDPGVWFPTQIPFDGPGHGYEDDWHFYDVTKTGTWEYSLAIDGPIYLHDQVVSKRSLNELVTKYPSEQRKIAFEQRWGVSNWFERMNKGELNIETEVIRVG